MRSIPVRGIVFKAPQHMFIGMIWNGAATRFIVVVDAMVYQAYVS